MRFRFDKIDRFIRALGGEIRHSVLFDYGWFDKICDNIKCLVSEKSGITDSINHNFGKIRIDLYSSLPTKKILTFHNMIILFKSLVNKNKNEYYYNMFLKKGSCKDKSDTRYFLMNVCILSMLYFNRIGISEGIDVNETSASKECDICHYWYFLKKGFKFQPNVCSRCHDLLMMSMNLSDIAILNSKGSDYRCLIRLMSKNEAVNLM